MGLTFVNPQVLHTNPAFSHGAYIDGPGRLVSVGGQNAVDTYGSVIGDDIVTQTTQALTNVFAVLASAGADQTHVIKLGIYMVAGHDAQAASKAALEMWGKHPVPITVLQVSGLANPQYLVEIDALAFVPDTQAQQSHQ